MTDNGKETPVRPAATVLLVRDSANGIEVLMVERNADAVFVAGALVFPGGRLDEADTSGDALARCDGIAGLNEEDAGLRVAAIRESYEEAGVLLARRAGEGALISDGEVQGWKAERKQIHDGELPMGSFANTHDLRLAGDLLVPYAQWITPKAEFNARRFNTRFFLAEAPAGHQAVHDGSELVDSLWITPQQAVADADAKRRQIVFVTRMNLARLGESKTVAEALDAARGRPIVPVHAIIEQREDGTYARVSADAGYGMNEMKIR